LTVFLHRPYRAPSDTALSILGLTPQAISHHPFGVLELIPPRQGEKIITTAAQRRLTADKKKIILAT
jgi:hypothetical protein